MELKLSAEMQQRFREALEMTKNGGFRQNGSTATPISYPLSYRAKVIRDIRKRYSIEDELALINNYNAYLFDNRLVEYNDRYKEYQAYRQECKNKNRE